MMDRKESEITYILMKNDMQGARFYEKGGKRFAEVPKGTKVTADNGGWLLQMPNGESTTLEGKPVILIQ